MFGNIVANFQDLSEEETDRYQALYCGLCRSIKERYGQLPRAGLSFDLTFFVLVLDSLYEPEETLGASICPAHPIQKKTYVQSIYSDYAADLSVLFTYYKCLDDWADEKKLTSRSFAALLEGAFKKAYERRSCQAGAIDRTLKEIQELERLGADSLDAAANLFGHLVGELFAYQDDHWSESLRKFGYELGRFIYAMDAAIDTEKDHDTGNYNPFAEKGLSIEDIQTMLTVLIGRASEAFEKLPLVQDIHLLRSVLYAGVWQQYTFAKGGSCE